MRAGAVVLLFPALFVSACNFDPRPARDPVLEGKIAETKARLATKPDDAALSRDLAQLYFEAKRPFEAADQFQHAIAKNPKDPRAQSGLADVYLKVGFVTRAVEHLRECMTIDRNDGDCLYVLGMLFKTDGSDDGLREARRTWKQLLAVAPNHAQAAKVRNLIDQIDAKIGPETAADARAPHGLGEETPPAPDPDPAPSADTVIPGHETGTHDPDGEVGELNEFGAALQRAFEAIRKNDAPGAEASFSDALKIQPDDPSALCGLAQALLAQRKDADALTAIERAIKLHPKDSQARWTLGLVLFRMGKDVDRAVATWELLVQEDPEYAKRMKIDEQLARVKQALQQRKVH